MFNLGYVSGPISCLMGRYFYLSKTLQLFWDPKRGSVGEERERDI